MNARRLRFLLPGISLVAACDLVAAPSPHAFRPSDTDPAITTFDNFQFAYIDTAIPRRNQLVLFLPGTGGAPIAYREYLKNAATSGFHSLGLMYVNPAGINELCNQTDPFNPNCHELTRLEVIDGTDRSALVDIDRTNSIENRLIKAIQYLHATFPALNWGQFLSGETILWNKIAVAGHSQGAGHAILIARDHEVARCCNFAGLDWWAFGGAPANWLSQPFATPVDRIYILGHQRDESVNFNFLQIYAGTIDVARYGGFVTPELESAPDFRHTHFLATNVEPVRAPPDGRYHGAMVTDLDTPFESDGVTPVLKSAWDYMLLAVTPPVRMETDATGFRVFFSPGTLAESPDLSTWTPIPSATSPYGVPFTTAPGRLYFQLE